MERQIFERYKGCQVKIGLKPQNFVISGIIDDVFEDCIQFRTEQKTSYLEFECISSLIPKED